MLDGKKLNILLIDDDETTNFLNSRTLKKAGIVRSIQITENGKDAINYLTCNGKYNHIKAYPKPDLVFLDINMPIMNGWEFLEAYDQLDPATKANVILIMLTTSLKKEDHSKAQTSKYVQGMVHKPLNQKTLGSIIAKHYDQLMAKS
jgi:CheY-like chemotaxis protein